MGNTGSLALGGVLGLMAVIVRQEFLLAIVGGVFVIETISVIVQVAVHRWTRRRVFRCAPLHHHFQLLGWPESKIVVRFWIASVLCAVLGLGHAQGQFERSQIRPPRIAWPAGTLPLARTSNPNRQRGSAIEAPR